MEALTAVAAAALTPLPTCLAVDRGMVIGGDRAVEDAAGGSGGGRAESRSTAPRSALARPAAGARRALPRALRAAS